MSHQPPLPPRPMSGKEIVDAFVSYIEQFQRSVKSNPKLFDEMCGHMDDEIRRFGKVHQKTILNPQPEDLQETLTLNRRLSIMSLLRSYLSLSR